MDQRHDGSNLSLIFTTIARNNCARRLIDSALRFYPRLQILVADQNPPTQEMTSFYHDRAVQVDWVPFDHGVSAGRALLARKVRTPYLIYGDDDFVFTSRTRFAPVVRYLDARPDVALVTGGMVDQTTDKEGRVHRSRRRYETYMYRDAGNRGLIAVPIDHVRPKVDILGDEIFYECDLGLNWAVARASLFEDERFLWDSQFKTNGEHENFFLQLKEFGGGRVMYYPLMECDHLPETHTDYDLLRQRDSGWAAFGRKWNVDWFLHVGKAFFQYKNYTGTIIKYAPISQGAAEGLPPRRDDYLRIWGNGMSAASQSDRVVLREAGERARQTWEKAEKRIEGLRARLQKTDEENERMARVIADLRDKLKCARNGHASAPPAAPVPDAHLARVNSILSGRNAELSARVAQQKSEVERQQAVIAELREKLKKASAGAARVPAGH